MKPNPKKLNAVIGYPLSHSRSPVLHNSVYELLKLNAVLLPFSNPDIKQLMAAIRALPIHLTAVTMPHKQSIMPLLDSVDGAAKAVGAVNTVVNRADKLTGYNTDIDGISYALRGTNLKGKQVLVLGAGGAAVAVSYVVKKAGGKLLYLNRTRSRAEALRKRFGGKVVSLREISPQKIALIVNATPIGMYPKVNVLPIPKAYIRGTHTVFDLIYNPKDTKLLMVSRKKGAKAVSGLDMFAVQGLRQIELWTGKKLVTQRLVERVKKNLVKTL